MSGSMGGAAGADMMLDTFWNAANYIEGQRRFDQSSFMARSPVSLMLSDARRAGVNPIYALGYKGTPVSPTQPPSSNKSSLATGLSSLKSSAAQMRAAYAGEQKIKSEINLNIKKGKTEEELKDYYTTQALKALQDAKTSSAMEAKANEESKAIYYDNIERSKRKDLYRGKGGKILPWLDKIKEYIPFMPSKRR